ncbi:MAG: MurT ligase domain-containing protein [Terrimesophilobacter sp.]
MRYFFPILLGRLVRVLARLRGGGSAFPGLVVLKLAPKFLEHAVEKLPRGVVLVSGSNGKSTTTNMLVAVLRAHGVSVFTNPSGGNIPQGIASSLLASVSPTGRIREDLAVLEVDEGYGPALAKRLSPTDVLLINIQIDQLNRYHEPDRVYVMLRTVAEAARYRVILNSSDENLRAMGEELSASGRPVQYYSVSPAVLAESPHGLASATRVGDPELAQVTSLATVEAVSGSTATISSGTQRIDIELPARGVHYAADAAGAIAMARALLGDRFSLATSASAFANLDTVYGRGETLEAHGEPIEVIMMKNPPSLQLNLDALNRVPKQVLMAVDEGTPDPSWIYDTDFRMINHVDVLTGTKAWQIATRLAYAGIPVGAVIPDLEPALEEFLTMPPPEGDTKVALVNYELMMELRKLLGYLELEGQP